MPEISGSHGGVALGHELDFRDAQLADAGAARSDVTPGHRGGGGRGSDEESVEDSNPHGHEGEPVASNLRGHEGKKPVIENSWWLGSVGAAAQSTSAR